jgi:hypothetical protein
MLDAIAKPTTGIVAAPLMIIISIAHYRYRHHHQQHAECSPEAFLR